MALLPDAWVWAMSSFITLTRFQPAAGRITTLSRSTCAEELRETKLQLWKATVMLHRLPRKPFKTAFNTGTTLNPSSAGNT
ncbi:tudor domain-containing protein 15 isoform X7 [Artibeus jamaicensis]|uniref:tudor domain-containing protein 15 isoform X7 n=1 Tax=Artibeus jamaicensis TaxID=9417 RepID=UPI00235AEF2E|nr:tudor domain-containing protein 15 isoform X7 [Artibeus jamaicensis]